MDETTIQPPAAPVAPEEPTVEKTSRLKAFAAKHPRATKIVGITAGAVGIIAATSVVKNMKANKAKLVEAKEHAGEALDALSDSTSTPETEA